MIRKLRLKIVGISVIAVAVLLVSVLAAVALSTRSQMVRASESRLQEALAGHMLSGAQPGSGGGQPCFVADIYAAREKDTGLVSAKQLAEKIAEYGTDAFYLPSFDDIENYLLKKCKKNDLLITMGAGNVYSIGNDLLKK